MIYYTETVSLKGVSIVSRNGRDLTGVLRFFVLLSSLPKPHPCLKKHTLTNMWVFSLVLHSGKTELIARILFYSVFFVLFLIWSDLVRY